MSAPRRSIRQVTRSVKLEPIADDPVDEPIIVPAPGPTPSNRADPLPEGSTSVRPHSSSGDHPSQAEAGPVKQRKTNPKAHGNLKSKQTTVVKPDATDARRAYKEGERIKKFIMGELREAEKKLEKVERVNPSPELITKATAAVTKARDLLAQFTRQREESRKAALARRIAEQASREVELDQRREARMATIEEYLKRNAEAEGSGTIAEAPDSS